MSTDNDSDGSSSELERKRGFLSGELQPASAEQRVTDLDKSDDSDVEIMQLMSDSSRNSSRTQNICEEENGILTDNTEQGFVVKSRQTSSGQQKESNSDKNSTTDEGGDEVMSQEGRTACAQSPNLSDEAHGTPENSRRADISVPTRGKTSKSKKHLRKTHNRTVGQTSLTPNGWSAGNVHEEKHTLETVPAHSSVKGKRMQKKKKKPVREKRKFSSTEQELRSQARKLAASPRLFRAFQQKMGEWITQNYGRMIDIFRRFDTDQSGSISYEEFFRGMDALGSPTTKAEMYIMATTLDADNDNAIDYNEFAKLRRQYRAASGSFQKTADLPSADSPSMTQVQLLQPCSRCEVGIWAPVDEDMPRFVCLKLEWSSSHENESYPQSFCATVQSETSIYGVSQVVKKELGHCVMNVTIYRPLEGGKNELLSPEKKLSDYGFSGTLPPEPPEEASLIYDYEYPFLDCPLLMADLQLTRKDKASEEDTSKVERTSDIT